MKHIQPNFEGTSIQRYELSHGIVREVRNGCEYVMLTDISTFEAACAEDARRHAAMVRMQAQEEAYGGGQ